MQGFFLQMAQARWVGEVVLQGLHFGHGLEKEQALSFRLKEGIMKTFILKHDLVQPGLILNLQCCTAAGPEHWILLPLPPKCED